MGDVPNGGRGGRIDRRLFLQVGVVAAAAKAVGCIDELAPAGAEAPDGSHLAHASYASVRSTTLAPDSTPRRTAQARSFVLAHDLLVDPTDPAALYNDSEEGLHVDYALTPDGAVTWTFDGRAIPPALSQAQVPLIADPSQLPSWAQLPDGGIPSALMVSYAQKRRGEWDSPMAFDMIAASGDRMIAKASGNDPHVFVSLVGAPYAHTPRFGSERLLLPQSYFKRDPEVGARNRGDLELHVAVVTAGSLRDDEQHTATKMFPALQRLLGASLLVNEQMCVRFAPRVWHEVDLRPLSNSFDRPPGKFPAFVDTVFGTTAKMSIAYERVLDLGVGLSHLHEQYDNRFGGELDSLYATVPIAGVLAALVGTPDDWYQVFNGPIQDRGGWVDGTCIYYMLVRLPQDNPRYAVLWTDEQNGFCERWRALDLEEKHFSTQFSPIIAVPDQLPNGAPFDKLQFWSPFDDKERITDASRMAVARQIVLVTGNEGGRPELYSIHFAWPTMDRTWRWRALPDPHVDPSSLRIREDTTIVFRGWKLLPGVQSGLPLPLIPVVWYQRYLPADGQEQPSVADLGTPNRAKPQKGYAHPWSFVAGPVFELADRQFSHFGVHERVSSRIQFYRVTLDVERQDPTTIAAIMGAVWEDRSGTLKKKHRFFNWGMAAQLTTEWLPSIPFVLACTDKAGMYARPMTFKLRKVPGFGWILMHYDKRNDKLVPFDGTAPGEPGVGGVVLTSRPDPTVVGAPSPPPTVTLTVGTCFRNDVRQLHGRVVEDEPDAVSPPQVESAGWTVTGGADGALNIHVTFALARKEWAQRFNPDHVSCTDGPHPADNAYDYRQWVAVNIWRVKMGALLPGTSTFATLFDCQCADVFSPSSDLMHYAGTWTATRSHPHYDVLMELLTERGRILYGTSIWFVGATGLAAPADAVLAPPPPPVPPVQHGGSSNTVITGVQVQVTPGATTVTIGVQIDPGVVTPTGILDAGALPVPGSWQ